jgi:hypothetical protein
MGLTAWQVERLGVETFEGYPLRLQTWGYRWPWHCWCC